MNEEQIFILIVGIALVAITVITVMMTKQNILDISELENNFHRFKAHVGGGILDINRKLIAMEDKIKRIEHVRLIERVKKICDEESFSYEIIDHIEDGYAYIRIFTKELDTFFLSEISKICNYEVKARTEHLIRIKVNLKGE